MLIWETDWDNDDNPVHVAAACYGDDGGAFHYRATMVLQTGSIWWSLATSDEECREQEWCSEAFPTLDDAKREAQAFDDKARVDVEREGKSPGQLLYEAMHGDDKPVEWAGDWERSHRKERYERAAEAFKAAIGVGSADGPPLDDFGR